MENAADALLMAFAVLVFVIALSVTFSTLAQAKSTADVVLYYSDRENFQPPVAYDKKEAEDGGRTVGVDTVIATIERCIKEKFTVRIIDEKEYLFEYDTSSEKEIKENIRDFIGAHTGLHATEFRETYVEVTTSGQTYVGEDGTQLEENVGKKIYITYERVN